MIAITEEQTHRYLGLDRESRINTISFEGFSRDQEIQVKGLINSIGLPVSVIDRVSYLGEREAFEGKVLGHWDRRDGTLALYKSLEQLPLIAQLGTIVHEQTHALTPFKSENEAFYGSEEAIMEARFHAIRVALQSLGTEKYLNGYHAKLAAALKTGEINEALFIEETNAIMTELRFTNPNHLRQVEEAQINQVARLKRLGKIDQSYQATNIFDGVDCNLLAFMPQVTNKEELNDHIESLRNSLLPH